MEKTKLGLDIGTNSIGWAVVIKRDKKYNFLEKYDENGNLIPSKGSYIFPKGTLSNENSKAAERRGYRGARRRIDRIRLRKIATLKILEKFDLCPPFEEGELNRWKNKKQYPVNNEEFIKWQRTGKGKKQGNSVKEKLKQPYHLRHLAATQLGLIESKKGRWQLGRAFYHIAQRRGYLSNGEEEQTDDRLELFKEAVNKLMEEHFHEATYNYLDFKDAYIVVSKSYEGDIKAKKLGNKIKKFIDKNVSYEKIQDFIEVEFNRPENLGKVMTGINELSNKIKESGMPTIGSYFNSIYAKKSGSGVVNRIRGRYTHREHHYEEEFNYICNFQGVKSELKKELHNAIFYQRPLKSQKGLVGKCPLETKRKRIAISHPLFEEFRMWESINRIKIKTENDIKLRFLEKDEKESLIKIFQRKNDFEFKIIAEALNNGRTYRYIRDRKVLSAEIEFNFPIDKKLSACPTTYSLKKILKEKYAELPFLNTGHNDSTKNKITIEDAWHCLFTDSFGNKSKAEYRKYFAVKRLGLEEKQAEEFAKIKLNKGYGNLSKAAIKKITPYLKEGKIYSHAVFLANISDVLDRKLTKEEIKKVSITIKNALNTHKKEKQQAAIVNKYIDIYKESTDSLGDNEISISAFQKEINKQIKNWLGETNYNQLLLKEPEELNELKRACWTKFEDAVKNKAKKEIEYITSRTIPDYIYNELVTRFPDDENNIDIDKLYHPSAMETYPNAEKELGNPEISSIKNPVFNKAMHQIKQLVNELIKNGMVDKNTEVNVEVANEINSASYRRALAQWQKEQEDIRNWAKTEIQKLYKEETGKEISPSYDDITKFILWKEQNHKCLYTTLQNNIQISGFLGDNPQYDIEHTIPRSKFNDNSLVNKTLANADFNRNYKKTQLPALLNLSYKESHIKKNTIIANRDKFLKSYSISKKVPTWNVSLETLKNDLKRFKNAAKVISDAESHDEIMTKVHYTSLKLEYLKKKYDAFEKEEITQSFTHANLVDTRIITKYARAYLNSYFKKVTVINGKITDSLRTVWNLQGENEPKDRSNHIHHCIDAVTVACTEKGTVNRLSEAFHKYEKEYFDRHLHQIKVYLPEPMENFVETMKNLYKEVLIYHHKKDRLKPLLKELGKDNHKKINLRGSLNSENPYGRIEKNGKKIFVKREAISSLTGADITNIIDEGIKERLLKLADSIGWEKLFTVLLKDGEDRIIKENENRKTLAYKVYSKLAKAKANNSLMKLNLTKNDINTDFNDKTGFIEVIISSTLRENLNEEKVKIYRKKVIEAIDNFVRSKGIEVLLSSNESSGGIIIIPEDVNIRTGKKRKPMVLKKVRLKAHNQNQYPLKEYREIDKSKKDYKQDFYFLKKDSSNYELRVYGDLLPDEKGRMERKFIPVNTYNLVKNIYEKELELSLLFKMNRDDMFLVIDNNVIEISDELEGRDICKLQERLFKFVKFDDKGKFTLERHNYALGNVDNVPPEKTVSNENNLSNPEEVVIRRRATTFRAIPAKVDKLGRLDVEFSKNFIDKHINN